MWYYSKDKWIQSRWKARLLGSGEARVLAEGATSHGRNGSDTLTAEAARNGRADALVTYNIKHFAAAGGRFAIPILRPADVLGKVRG